MGGRRRRVLVIDNEELVVRSFARVLSPLFDVTALFSTADALTRVATGET